VTRSRPIFAAFVLPQVPMLLAVGLAYSNSFRNGFHFDDFHTVVDNPAVRSLANVPRFFTDATSFSVLPANRTYRPLVSTSLALDYAVAHGYVPLWFHVGTFGLFLALVLLLAWLYRQLLERARPAAANGWVALAGAAWFGLHPAMAETVNYIIQRGDLDCTLGCVAALAVFVRWPRLRRWPLYLLPFVAAMLCKPTAAAFPALLAGYVFLFEPGPTESGPAKPADAGRPHAGRRLGRACLAALPSLVAAGLLLWLQAAMTPKSFVPSTVPAWAYRLTQPYVWLRYAGALLLPLHLNVDTDLAPLPATDARVWLGMLFVAALLAAMVTCARRRRLTPVAFGLFWFLVTQLPTSVYPLAEVENDHRMFFSFAGLVLAAVCAAWRLLQWMLGARLERPAARWTVAACAVALLAAYGYGTHRRNLVWKDEASLWRDDVQKSPHNGRGLMIYGLTLMNAGQYRAALDLFTRALTYTPNYPTLEINLGVVNGALADAGEPARTAEAERHFQRALALAPGDDQAHAFYGRWLAQHGQRQEALAELRTAVALNPQRPMQRELLAQVTAAKAAPPSTADAWVNESLRLNLAGRYEESIAAAREALRLDPQDAEAWNNVAAGEEALHRWDAAIAAAQRALALRPGFQLAHNNLAWSLAQKRAARSGR